MEEKKFELTDETREWHGHTLHRIKALKKFGNVKKGDLGGFIEKEDNLSQDGNCWIYDDAKVYDNAIVYDDAQVICGAQIYGWAHVYDNALVCGGAIIAEFAQVYGNAGIGGYAKVYGHAEIFDNAQVYENTEVYGNAQIYGNAIVYNNATVCGDVYVNDSVKVYGHAKVSDNGDLDGGLNISGDSEVRKTSDYMAFKLNLDSNEWLTWTKSNNIWQSESFYGTGDELIKRAYNDSKESGKKYEALINMVKQINDGRKEI